MPTSWTSVDQTGKPIKNAEIVPVMFQGQSGKDKNFTWATLPPLLSAQLSTRSAADGSFVSTACRGTRRSRSTSVAGLRLAERHLAPLGRGDFELDRRVGNIEGRLTVPDRGRFEGTAVVELGMFGVARQWKEQK